MKVYGIVESGRPAMYLGLYSTREKAEKIANEYPRSRSVEEYEIDKNEKTEEE